MDYFDRMAAIARLKILERRRSVPLDDLRLYEPAESASSLAGTLREPRLTVIREIRRTAYTATLPPRDVPAVVAQSLKRGTKAFSVLARDEEMGGQGLLDLAEAAAASTPLLFRDIVIDEYQLYEARFLGATSVSLLPGVLGRTDFVAMAGLVRHMGLELVIEVRTEEDIEAVRETPDAIALLCGPEPGCPDLTLEEAFMLVSAVPAEQLVVCSCRGLVETDFDRLEAAGFDGCVKPEYLPKGLGATHVYEKAEIGP